MFMDEEEIVVPDPGGWWGCWGDMQCRCNYCGFKGCNRLETCWDADILGTNLFFSKFLQDLGELFVVFFHIFVVFIHAFVAFTLVSSEIIKLRI